MMNSIEANQSPQVIIREYMLLTSDVFQSKMAAKRKNGPYTLHLPNCHRSDYIIIMHQQLDHLHYKACNLTSFSLIYCARSNAISLSFITFLPNSPSLPPYNPYDLNHIFSLKILTVGGLVNPINP